MKDIKNVVKFSMFHSLVVSALNIRKLLELVSQKNCQICKHTLTRVVDQCRWENSRFVETETSAKFATDAEGFIWMLPNFLKFPFLGRTKHCHANYQRNETAETSRSHDY